MKKFSEIANKSKIPWVRLWIDDTWDFCDNFIDHETGKIDFEALGREEYEFRKALRFQDFSENDRAEYLWNEAVANNNKQRENGKKGGRPRKDTTADGDFREDSQDRKSGTSANLYGDADTREGSDASTTVSRNIGNDQGTDALEKARTVVNSGRVVKSATAAPRHKATAATVRLPSWPEFLQYVNANNVDYSDAREWFEMSIVDRDGKDREGNAIKNWKAALRAFCRAKQARRSA